MGILKKTVTDGLLSIVTRCSFTDLSTSSVDEFSRQVQNSKLDSTCPKFRQYAKVLSASGQPVLQPIRSSDLLSLIQAAGWPIWFIILCSILMVAIIGERFWTLRRNAAIPPNLFHDTVQAFRQQGGSRELIDRLSENSFLGRIFASGVANVQSTREVMKEAMEEAGRAVMVDMERFVNGLGTIATVAPLLGLFGTVVGMIEIFGASGPQGQNPAQLAH
ncbi:MAG: MotA/TolQ/ExbB proton channel family protein, partial [Betaproteobacteria bacterium]|nr:MotA/TolQ/ExbB proton channel family protein [Betaproteobacteria bacterium]